MSNPGGSSWHVGTNDVQVARRHQTAAKSGVPTVLIPCCRCMPFQSEINALYQMPGRSFGKHPHPTRACRSSLKLCPLFSVSDYQPNYYMWECLELLRKVMLWLQSVGSNVIRPRTVFLGFKTKLWPHCFAMRLTNPVRTFCKS